jgi:hypothetical protein
MPECLPQDRTRLCEAYRYAAEACDRAGGVFGVFSPSVVDEDIQPKRNATEQLRMEGLLKRARDTAPARLVRSLPRLDVTDRAAVEGSARAFAREFLRVAAIHRINAAEEYAASGPVPAEARPALEPLSPAGAVDLRYERLFYERLAYAPPEHQAAVRSLHVAALKRGATVTVAETPSLGIAVDWAGPVSLVALWTTGELLLGFKHHKARAAVVDELAKFARATWRQRLPDNYRSTSPLVPAHQWTPHAARLVEFLFRTNAS